MMVNDLYDSRNITRTESQGEDFKGPPFLKVKKIIATTYVMMNIVAVYVMRSVIWTCLRASNARSPIRSLNLGNCISTSTLFFIENLQIITGLDF